MKNCGWIKSFAIFAALTIFASLFSCVAASGEYRGSSYRYGENRRSDHAHRSTEVPRLQGRELNKALYVIDRNDLRTGRISYVETRDRGLDGKVGSQKPAPGARVKKGTSVDLTVYRLKGPGKGFDRNDHRSRGFSRNDRGNQVHAYSSRKVVVPDVVGLRIGQARKSLSSNGLDVGKIHELRTRERGRDGRVLKQDPRPGKTVNRKMPVNLWVDKF